MNHISMKDIYELINVKSSPCVSIYLPTEKAGKEVMQGKILLKNLLKEGESQLLTPSMDESSINKMLKPAYDFVDDTMFWQNCEHGLALFITPENFTYYKVPTTFEPHITISDDFQIIPILQLATMNQDYYILSLSQKKVRLFQCNPFEMEEINLENIPTSLDEALQLDTPERQLQSHPGTASASQSVFHGHGGGEEDNKSLITRFMQKLSDAILTAMPYKDIPMITVGVEYINAIYKETNKYPHLIDKTIEGSPESFKEKDLKVAGDKIMSEENKKLVNKLHSQYDQIKARGNGTEILSDIVAASYQGRVNDLVVASDAVQWGLFDEEKQLTHIYDAKSPNAKNLVNMSAIKTLENNGKVYVFPSHQIPGQHKHFALFRY